MKLVVNGKSHILDDGTNILAFWARDGLDLDLYQQLVDQHGVPDILISEAHPEYAELSDRLQYHYCPTFLHNQTSLLTNNCAVGNQPAHHCFNFMINRKQINRFLLLKLVEWFDLSCYQYTWSGTGQQFDMTRCLHDFDTLADQVDVQTFKSHMLAPVSKISPNFVDKDLTVKSNIDNHLFGVKDYGRNDWVWNNVVGDMFERSAVSLISESVQHEKIIIYTEKTLYAMLGLTFPIWVGGYRQADLWKQHGFDVFDDVIDHSYQYRDTLLERCFYALNDNLCILSDLEHARNLKHKHMLRLEQNRSMMQSNIHDILANSMTKLPKILQNFIAGNQQ
jgi:hypothetical protein